ncbi:hypothetical protein ACVBGC_24655 [Burkholderia stagnalis]
MAIFVIAAPVLIEAMRFGGSSRCFVKSLFSFGGEPGAIGNAAKQSGFARWLHVKVAARPDYL